MSTEEVIDLVGDTFAVTPVLSSSCLEGDICLATLHSKLLSPVRVDAAIASQLRAMNTHIVLKLVRV